MAHSYSYWHRVPLTKVLYFLITVSTLPVLTTVVNMSKFTSYHLEQLCRKFHDTATYYTTCNSEIKK